MLTFTWAYYICIVSQFIIPAYRWVMMMLTKSFLWLSCLKSIRNSVIIHFIAKEVRVKATKTLNVILAQQKGIPLQGEKTTRVSEQYWFVCFASSYTYGKYEQDRSLDIIPWEKKEIRTAHYYKLSCSSCNTKPLLCYTMKMLLSIWVNLHLFTFILPLFKIQMSKTSAWGMFLIRS